MKNILTRIIFCFIDSYFKKFKLFKEFFNIKQQNYLKYALNLMDAKIFGSTVNSQHIVILVVSKI